MESFSVAVRTGARVLFRSFKIVPDNAAVFGIKSVQKCVCVLVRRDLARLHLYEPITSKDCLGIAFELLLLCPFYQVCKKFVERSVRTLELRDLVVRFLRYGYELRNSHWSVIGADHRYTFFRYRKEHRASQEW